MFWTQNLKSLAVSLALGIVNITEESGCPVGGKRESVKQLNRGKLLYTIWDIFFLPFYSCRVHGAKGGLTLILSKYSLWTEMLQTGHVVLCLCLHFMLGSKNTNRNNHLCVTSLHMSQSHFWIDGMTTWHTENLQVCVLAITFIHLVTQTKVFHWLEQGVYLNVQAGRPLPTHLLILLHRLLLGLGDDALQFVEAPLHLGEAQSSILLVPADALQLLLAVLLSDAGTLLPLLDALRENLIDPAVDQHSRTD